VLAAVALLAILYTVLARVAIEGLRAEGDSQQRLDASMIADERMFELEIPTGGISPPLGRSETQLGDYTLTLAVAPFQPPAEWDVGEAEGYTPLIFAAPPAGSAGVLRTAQLTVSWLEADGERHITRTTYLIDNGAWVNAVALAASGNPAAPPAGNEGTQAPELGGMPPPSEGEPP
jgi:hypothetical protein